MSDNNGLARPSGAKPLSNETLNRMEELAEGNGMAIKIPAQIDMSIDVDGLIELARKHQP